LMRLTYNQAQMADWKNVNGRIYPSSVLKRESAKLHAKALLGEVMMNCTHQKNKSEDDVAGPQGAGGILKSCVFDENSGNVQIKVDVPDTSAGRDIRAIVKAGGKIGTSARGGGSSKVGKYITPKGESLEGEIIQDDYFQKTYDFVTTPSVTPARVSSIQESVLEETTMDIDLLKKNHPDLVKKIADEAVVNNRTENLKLFETKLSEKESELRTEITEQVRAELTALGTSVESDSVSKEIADLKAENEALKKDKILLTESTTGGNPKLLESLNTKVTGLETDLAKRDAMTWLEKRCSGHASGAAILKRCSDAKTVTEAESMFKAATDLLEEVSKTAATNAELGGAGNAANDGKGKGEIPKVNETITESAKINPEKLSSKSKAQLLAGTDK